MFEFCSCLMKATKQLFYLNFIEYKMKFLIRFCGSILNVYSVVTAGHPVTTCSVPFNFHFFSESTGDLIDFHFNSESTDEFLHFHFN